jgi:dihydroxyacetone kinase-like protein
MNKEYIKKLLLNLEGIYKDNLEYISELDAAIGDGDHGVSMVRGFKAVRIAVEQTKVESIPQLLDETGNVLMKEIGGTCGPLYAMFFKKGALAVRVKDELDTDGLYAFMKAGAEGLMNLGKAQAGDKTMVDALAPAVEALKTAAEKKEDILIAAKKAGEAANRGRDETAGMVSKCGRGRYQGDASKGHIDAGAASMAILINAFAGKYN